MTPDERREYNRAYRLANVARLATYRPKQLATAKARYRRDRGTLLAKSNAYNQAHREEIKARAKVYNAASGALAATRVATMKRTFELLPENQREEYAHWLLLLADLDTTYASALRTPSLDYGYIAAYSGY